MENAQKVACYGHCCMVITALNRTGLPIMTTGWRETETVLLSFEATTEKTYGTVFCTVMSYFSEKMTDNVLLDLQTSVLT